MYLFPSLFGIFLAFNIIFIRNVESLFFLGTLTPTLGLENFGL